MGFVQKIEEVTEVKWYKFMMPKLYGTGGNFRAPLKNRAPGDHTC